jgi:hypothetical protein
VRVFLEAVSGFDGWRDAANAKVGKPDVPFFVGNFLF